MAFRIHVALLTALVLAGSGTKTFAQDINLGAGGADLIWRGQSAQSGAGSWLDQGAVHRGDGRNDLIIGAPGSAGVAGRVYVLFGGPTRTGELSLGAAETIIEGPGAGDGFGTATATGNIINLPANARRSLVVGAPGAAGGNGVVYLFLGGFGEGNRLTASDAVLTITGGPGDRLGSTLTTGDLNGDGYREIIMGAPGTSRVYILYGGDGLSGARLPDVTITGAGLGGVLSTGDITDDQVDDLLIGAPGQSLVYLLKGDRVVRFPAAMHVSRDEDAYFYSGLPDAAGTSLYVADFNGDSRPDLFIGAPYGGASQTGAVYVLFGNAQRGVTHLAQADLTFYGPIAGAHMGRIVTAGDMNRDGHHDLAMVTSTGPGGVGEILVYYGRAGSMGTPGPSGRPVIDMGFPENVSRRVIGDGDGGVIRSTVIFEVTGEGARDVIVGAPHGNSSAGLGSGLVYFSNSPRLSLPVGGGYLAAVQGQSGTVAISVRNQSTVPITWQAQPRGAWQAVNPASGSAVRNEAGSFVVTGSSAGLAPGRYDANVTVSSTSHDLEMFRNLPIRMAVFTAPTLMANRSFPAQAGAPITWTAQTNAGALELLYQFWRHDTGSGWRMVRDYSPTNTYSWTPGQGDVGEHHLQVWIRSTLSPLSYDVYAATGAFSVVTPTPVIHSLESDTAFPAALGSPLRWTVNATGGIAPLEYQFWGYRQGAGWSVLQAYSSASTYTWTPAATGTYAVQAWVRNAGSPLAYNAWAGSSLFEVSTSAPVVVQSLAPDSALPLKVGTRVTWTARASGGTAGPLQYRFWRYDASRAAWAVVRDYAASPTYAWNVSAGDEGGHAIQVWVRSAGSSASYQAYTGTGMFEVVRDPVTVSALTPNVAFPIATGTPVTWTATAHGGANLQYRYYVYSAASGWTLLRDYAAANSVQWTPTQAGTYHVQVWVRSADSAAAYEAWRGTGSLVVQPPG